MTHGDDTGLVTPPRLAQHQAVIVPIYRKDEDRAAVLEVAGRLREELAAKGFRVHLDARDGLKPGAKYYEWEGKGVPLRIEVGPRDVAAGTVMLARRIGGKESIPRDDAADRVGAELEAIQRSLLEAARERREANSLRAATKDEFIGYLEGGGGFVYAGWCGSAECEQTIKDQTKATIRVLPDEEFRSDTPPATCVWCGSRSTAEAIWARAY
jgi:prolyl-tRNA synthetase